MRVAAELQVALLPRSIRPQCGVRNTPPPPHPPPPARLMSQQTDLSKSGIPIRPGGYQ